MAQRPSYASIAHHKSFSHERLRLAENSIRLFQVQTGAEREPIRLRITQYSTHRRPQYSAVSYTWGSSTNLQDILVNGQAFKIHYNLWNLLLRLRARKVTSFLWADAICIDQANLRERNFHVQLMGNIYEQAQSVIVWLGLPAPDWTERRAMDLIRDTTLFRQSYGDAKFAQTYLKPDYQHRWETLLRMCEHIYWTRTWIVQEFLRAPDVEVICGAASINWSEFEHLLPILQKSPFNVNPTILQILQSRTVRLTLRRRARTASTLHELLKEYHDSTCTENRDKVYGILGLASDCIEDELAGQVRGMVPDYDKHIVEVYLDAVTCIKKSLPSLNSLPSVVNLVRQTLFLSNSDFANYIVSDRAQKQTLPTLTIVPEYVGIVEEVLPSWSSIRDLKSQLSSIDWGRYVGYEVKSPYPGLGRRSASRPTHAAIPEDLLTNMVNLAETDPDITCLYNYPSNPDLVVPQHHIALHADDKRMYDNSDISRPRIIIEQNDAVDMLRLGFACTNTRKGDLIFQFKGLDVTIIGRQIGSDILLVGKAIMTRNSEIIFQLDLDPVSSQSPWISHCPLSQNLDNIELQTDALSLAELIARA